jgi:hypothetical protein
MTTTAWREPARALPLRWGTYNGRYLAGILYIVGGALILVASNTYTVPFLLVGTVAHVGGWYSLPGIGVRRIWMAWPSLISVWLLLTGPQILFVMALPLLAWLVVRQRPLLSYVVLMIPVGVGIVLANLFDTNQPVPLALAIECAAVVGSAWLARALAVVRACSVARAQAVARASRPASPDSPLSSGASPS